MEEKGFLDIYFMFPLVWDNIPVIRESVKKMVGIGVRNITVLSNIELTISELLENVVKYSQEDKMQLRILGVNDGTQLEISVKNSADREKINQLQQKIENMKKRESLDYYMECLRSSREYKKKYNSAGCGLARIYHEANGKILLTVEGNYIILTVHIDLDGIDSSIA